MCVARCLFYSKHLNGFNAQVSAYGQKFVNLDIYNKLDLILVTTCIFVLVAQTGVYMLQIGDVIQQIFAGAFIALISARFMHAIKYLEVCIQQLLTSSGLRRLVGQGTIMYALLIQTNQEFRRNGSGLF